jgi:dTDP-4-dehydrorhamnose reductase
MSNVLILGAYGLLGSSLSPYLESAGYKVFRQGRKKDAQININSIDANILETVLKDNAINSIVNLVALTSVELCENELKQAYSANIGVLESIVVAINKFHVDKRPHLVTVSTDHVYDGVGPHKEGKVSPCNIYALSKLAGEFVAAQVGATILRTNFIGKSHCRERMGLTDWIVDSLRSSKTITVYEDVKITPLHISTLCMIISLVIKKQKLGTYNLGSSSGNSKAYLAFQMARKLKLDTDFMVTGMLDSKKQVIPRPFDMRMDSSLFEETFDYDLPTFDSQIAQAVKEYLNE